jgi:hypothetical protein
MVDLVGHNVQRVVLKHLSSCVVVDVPRYSSSASAAGVVMHSVANHAEPVLVMRAVRKRASVTAKALKAPPTIVTQSGNVDVENESWPIQLQIPLILTA